MVTVRTKSSDKLSNESSAATIPVSVRNKISDLFKSCSGEDFKKFSDYSGGARPRDPPGELALKAHS